MDAAAATIPVGQAIIALAFLMLFTLVGKVHKRYTSRTRRLAVLASLYVLGMTLSASPDKLSTRLGGFLMGGACVWMASARTASPLQTEATSGEGQTDTPVF